MKGESDTLTILAFSEQPGEHLVPAVLLEMVPQHSLKHEPVLAPN